MSRAFLFLYWNATTSLTELILAGSLQFQALSLFFSALPRLRRCRNSPMGVLAVRLNNH